MRVIVSKNEMKAAIKLYIEQKLNVSVNGEVSIHEADQYDATHAEAYIKPKAGTK